MVSAEIRKYLLYIQPVCVIITRRERESGGGGMVVPEKSDFKFNVSSRFPRHTLSLSLSRAVRHLFLVSRTRIAEFNAAAGTQMCGFVLNACCIIRSTVRWLQ